MTWLLSLARPHWRPLALAACLAALCTASSVALMATSAWLIASAALAPPILSLSVAIVGVRFFALARAALRYAERLTGHDVSLRILDQTRVQVYRWLEPLAPAGFDERHSGDLLRRVTADIDALQDFFARIAGAPLVFVVAAALVTLLVGAILPAAGFIVLLGLTAATVLATFTAISLEHRRAPALAKIRGDLNIAIVEFLQAAPELIAFGAAETQVRSISRLDFAVTDQTRRSAWASGLGDGLVVAITGITAAAAIAVTIPAVHAGRVGGVWLAVVGLAAIAAFEAATIVSQAGTRLPATLAAAQRLLELGRRRPATIDPPDPRPVPLDMTLEIRDARLRYGPAAPAAFDGLSLRLEPGARVAVLGPSGAGKSSLAAAIVRFRELESGQITLGGTDVRDLRQTDLRRCIGLSTQEPHLFATSIRENFRLARPDATQAEMDAAADAACLLPWIETLDDGWNTLVGELGVRVSGGERRRIAIARLLLARPPILILDEPTAHLDGVTARAVLRNVLTMMAGHSILLITHRLDDTSGFDQILSLPGGAMNNSPLRLRGMAGWGP
jgi:thiol reductant ABC exporter CydC subunit